jgi:hypothetical protein
MDENINEYQLTDEMKLVLDERLKEDINTYLTEEESIKKLIEKFQ